MQIGRVEIERLLLEGIEVADPAAFGRSVEAELRRLLSAQEWTAPERTSEIRSSDAGAIDWQAASGSDALARAVAERIAGVIPRGGAAR